MSESGPQRIQGSLLLTRCIQLESPSVGIFSPVFIEGLVSSNCNFSLVRDELFTFLMGCDVSVTTGLFEQGNNRRHTITVVLGLFITLRGVRIPLNLYPTRNEHCEC
jgi:hypothetical protein